MGEIEVFELHFADVVVIRDAVGFRVRIAVCIRPCVGFRAVSGFDDEGYEEEPYINEDEEPQIAEDAETDGDED